MLNNVVGYWAYIISRDLYSGGGGAYIQGPVVSSLFSLNGG
jgi:hypothetical protein